MLINADAEINITWQAVVESRCFELIDPR